MDEQGLNEQRGDDNEPYMQMQIILIIISIGDWRELRKSPGL